LRRLSPINSRFGSDRGKLIDRYYIESFLQRHCTDIIGKVLEIGDPRYTFKFGGERVTHFDVLHITSDNPQTTLGGDLQIEQNLPLNANDCMIFTQTLLFIYDVHAAIANCYRFLKYGGVLLATFPGISKVVSHESDKWGRLLAVYRSLNLEAFRECFWARECGG